MDQPVKSLTQRVGGLLITNSYKEHYNKYLRSFVNLMKQIKPTIIHTNLIIAIKAKKISLLHFWRFLLIFVGTYAIKYCIFMLKTDRQITHILIVIWDVPLYENNLEWVCKKIVLVLFIIYVTGFPISFLNFISLTSYTFPRIRLVKRKLVEIVFIPY